MADRKLTRNQRRQIDKLASHVHCFFEADIAFFDLHPDRQYHVRRAGDAEIAEVEILGDELMQAPHGWCWFAIVKKVSNAYFRVFVANGPRAETGLDASDDDVDAIWEKARPDTLLIRDVLTADTDGLIWERMAGPYEESAASWSSAA